MSEIIQRMVVPLILLAAVVDHAYSAYYEQSYDQAARAIIFAVVVVGYEWSVRRNQKQKKLNPTT